MIAVIKYNGGNIGSIANALKRLNTYFEITDNIDIIEKADKVIFPGVGEASSAMAYLNDRGLSEVIKHLKKPTLGICLGMQLMCTYSEENQTQCMGIFDTNIKMFPSSQKVPHIGWNNLFETKGSLFNGIQESDVYFVHSYYAEISNFTVAKCDYIFEFSAALQKDNFYAVQFHPEKSANYGASILNKFLEL
ncbi:MAG: imidazole glycerol phosphate synthase subunit HisH [Bacteroidota bacterium]|jgi:glutamine amidotransferase